MHGVLVLRVGVIDGVRDDAVRPTTRVVVDGVPEDVRAARGKNDVALKATILSTHELLDHTRMLARKFGPNMTVRHG